MSFNVKTRLQTFKLNTYLFKFEIKIKIPCSIYGGFCDIKK